MKRTNNQSIYQISRKSIIQSDNQSQTNSQQRTNRNQQIMMQSISVIQKSRAEIQNRSNSHSQSIRDTMIISQKQQNTADQSATNTNNISLVKVSEQHSENCSLIDEHESSNQAKQLENEISSSESKNSDKENSNIRNNKDINQPLKHITPNPRKSKTKVGLSEQQIKNIRQAPIFKGLSSVLKTSEFNKSPRKNKKLVSNKNGDEDDLNMKEVSTRLSRQFKQIQEKAQNKPLVFTHIDKPNVYHIVGSNSYDESFIQPIMTQNDQCYSVERKQTQFKGQNQQQTSNQSPKMRQNNQYHEGMHSANTKFNAYSQFRQSTDQIQFQHRQPQRPQIMSTSTRVRKNQNIPHSIEYDPHARLNTDGNTYDNTNKYQLQSNPRQLQVSFGSSIVSYNQSLMPQHSPMYSNSNNRSEFQSIVSNQGITNQQSIQGTSNLKTQLSLINEESCKRLHTDPVSYNLQLNNQRSQESLNSNIEQQKILRDFYKNKANSSNPSIVLNQMQMQTLNTDPNNHILTINDFIDFNEINEGIVYVEGGIGLHQKKATPKNTSINQQQQQTSSRQASSNRATSSLVQKARQYNNQYLNQEPIYQNQGYIDMSKNSQNKVSKFDKQHAEAISGVYYNQRQNPQIQTTQISGISTAPDCQPHVYQQQISSNISKQKLNKNQNLIYCETEPAYNNQRRVQSNVRRDNQYLMHQRPPLNPNERYIEALKKMMKSGKNHIDPNSSGSDTENEENEFILGQKIFFTEGGRTNKVKQYNIEFIHLQNSKQLLAAAQIKKRSKEEEEISKQNKCIIF
ncbi:UNKNOWN [Stylonychia lemnae]|uniref:Uncharacterized protein n=1 Tax=Stylonychia lemnae TaxID=5949 RepID=A0A078A9M2_STYLE|nr:UNKNOWN [Stylonychia lemnae]|eukprot:CDW77498.1 UNKNOWN [Stylonychia lemnae]